MGYRFLVIYLQGNIASVLSSNQSERGALNIALFKIVVHVVKACDFPEVRQLPVKRAFENSRLGDWGPYGAGKGGGVW